MDQHSTAEPRRTFLRQLLALPLVGGAMTLIGQPTAAAIPVTDALHERYLGWLALEHQSAVREHAYRSALAHGRGEAEARACGARAHYTAWVPTKPDLAAMVAAGNPSSRAAVILSAAGVPLI